MGLGAGRTRRSKQLPKSSSTVLCCDTSGSVEDCKQKIKVKGSAPVNQQRFAFTSQRLIDKSIVLANFSSTRQWQIVIDSPIEEICKDLSSWRAVFHSKTVSGQLLFPTVIKENEHTTSSLYSRTAEDLRQLGVSCDAFFLLFNKWLPNSQLEKSEDPDSAKRNTAYIDFQIDEKFQKDSFLIDLSGELNGVHISMPVSYVMNGREVVTKLHIVEQTVHYREKHKQRYQDLRVSPLKEADNGRVSQDSPEVECPFYPQDYGLRFEKSCEFTAFISQDQRRVRCIVIPLVIIPLHGEISLKKQGIVQFSRCSPENMIREFSSVISHTEGDLSSAPEKFTADEVSVVCKASKKKKKRKSRRHSKVDVKNLQLSNDLSDTDRKKDVDINLPLPCGQTEVVKLDGLKPEHCSKTQAGYVSDSDIDNKERVFTNDVDLHHIELKSSVGGSSDYGIPENRLRNMDVEPQEPSFVPTLNSLDASQSSKEQIDIENGEHHHNDKRMEVCKEFAPENENHGYQPTVLISVESDFGSQGDGNDLASNRKTTVEVGVSSPEDSSENRNSWLNKDKLVSDALLRIDHVKNKSEPQFERKDQFSNHVRPSRDGFWTRKASEGAESNFRNRMYQSSSNFGIPGESRSSLPFWRHQRVDPQRTAQPWSKLSLSQREEWSFDRVGMPYSHQWRSAKPFPDVRQGWGSNRRREGAVDNKTLSAQEQKNISNGQSLRTERNYEIYSHSIRKWLGEDVPKEFSSISKTCQPSILESLQQKWVAERDPSNVNACSSPAPIVPNNKDGTSSAVSALLTGAGSREKDASNLVQGTAMPNDRVAKPSSILSQSCDATNKCNRNRDSETACGLYECNQLKKQMIDHVCSIVDVVQASYQSAVIYQQVSVNAGGPLCEFDKFAKAVAPVLKLPESSFQHSKSMEHTGADVADLPLHLLWDWYEEPSCFGLEVKLTDYKTVFTKQNVNSEFHAYFVPFLSAIQLFGWPRKEKTNCKDPDVDENAADPFHCSFCSQPNFSVLTNDDIAKVGSVTNNMRHCNCVELLYEFFEGESPPQRRPLSEKIKQLVMGRVALESTSGSDACVLTSMNIRELHPSSWFAVAWYPIYRIPDGTFRSTFLTYHSLSSLQFPVATNGYQSCGNMLTVPVVGLMSYNVQAKDWFAINSPHSKNDDGSKSVDANPAQLLQEHLMNLAAAAACMARGCSDKLSGFKHLDYNFFQNRGR